MRNRFLAAMMVSLSLALVSCGAAGQSQEAASGDTAAEAASAETGTAAQEAETAQAAATDQAALPQLKPTEVVTVVIPAAYADVSSQEEADKIRETNGYESVVLQDDGGILIVMTRESHEKLISEFSDSVEQGIRELSQAEEYPDIISVTHNDDYSLFTVTVDGDEVSRLERLCADELVMYGTLYHIYTGNDVERIKVEFVGKESGETIETAESAELS